MDVQMTSSFAKFQSCTASQFGMVVEGGEDLINATVEMLLQTPPEVGKTVTFTTREGLECAALLFCFAICFVGFRLVRIVNLCAGLILGGSLALFFLELVAPQIAQETCVLVVLLTLTMAAVLGIICAAKRKSLYFVLGVIAAQIAGDMAYDLLLLAGYGRTAEGTTSAEAARGCISFFSVLGLTLVFFYADLAWILITAVVGAYGMTFFAIKLIVIPYVDPKFADFETFRPTTALELDDDDIVYVYIPFACCLVLALLGFLTQLCCNRRRRIAEARGAKVTVMV